MTQDTERWTGDCGVCGVPATQWNEVCEGYSVPRCYAHAGHQAYQAESRLARAASSLQEVERERDELREALERIANRSLVDGPEHLLLADFQSIARSALSEQEGGEPA